jgi:iron(III) transport system ATP-binding protein
MLSLVGLPELSQRFPHELSGGQQQRVALARALAPSPAVLLLDEPFSSLDPDLRERLALELRDLLKRAGTTTLLVTHDQYEAFALADRVGVMNAGRIEQWDTPYRPYTSNWVVCPSESVWIRPWPQPRPTTCREKSLCCCGRTT